MKFVFILFSLLLTFKAFPQTFVKSFDPVTPIGNAGAGVAVKCADGNVMVFSNSLMKFDTNGNELWTKDINFSVPTTVLRASLLTDSCVAFLLTASSPNIGSVIKVDNDGNIIWYKEIFGTDPNQSIYGMESDSAGGVFLASGGYPVKNGMLSLDKNGNFINGSSHIYTAPSLNTYISNINHDRNAEYACLGVALSNLTNGYDIAFLKSNRNGIVSTYKEIVIDSMNASSIGFSSIIESKSGGHYCFYLIEADSGSLYDRFALLYLNVTNNVEWGKLISTPGKILFPDFMNPTADNGCLITASHVYQNSIQKTLFSFLKFDSTGTLEWTKTVGDTNIITQRYLQPYFLLKIQTGEWMSFYSTPTTSNYFHLAKTDSVLNGFCNYSQTIFQSSPLIFQQQDYSSTSFSENYTLSNGIFFESPNSMNMTLECSTTNILNRDKDNLLFNIFPNPASSFVNLKIFNPQEYSNLRIRFINIQGAEILNLKLENKLDNRLDLNCLQNGVYFYFISENNLPIYNGRVDILK